MATKKKMLQAAAGNAGGEALNVEDVFSTYLYEGTSATHVIDNGIDLDGEGGLVWTKVRTITDNHYFWDTERGVNKRLSSNQSFGENNETDALNSFNSDGFTLGSALNVNGSAANWGSAADYTSWTFRKAPKFFDVVTYTGNGVAGREIAHNLGSVPGSIFVKKTSGANNWLVYHRSLGNSAYARLNTTDESFADGGANWNSTTPTSTVFTLGSDGNVNDSDGSTYVAYLFAHNDGDGDFGGEADADIIKCGSYTGNGSYSAGPEIDLGFEPQWVLIKNVTTGYNWQLGDIMRGASTEGAQYLSANTSNAEAAFSGGYTAFIPTPTGFTMTVDDSNYNRNGDTYIYMAIRRGTKVPESATEVFEVATRTAGLPSFEAPFAVDMGLVRKGITASGGVYNASRLTGTKFLYTNGTDAEANDNGFVWDFMDGWANDGGTSSTVISWMWKRAPGFFDVVAYTGNSTAGRTVSHNLGVAPEMMWFKKRNAGVNWLVHHKDLTGSYPSSRNYLSLNLTNSEYSTYQAFTTAPTESSITLSSQGIVNGNNDTYIAYLFASLPGISKVGSFTQGASSQTIDCGFTSGARFVLFKRYDTGSGGSTGHWHVFDSERGIVAGNDPFLKLNNTNGEDAGSDVIDPHSSGFTVNTVTDVTNNGESFIFYAIA